MWALRVADDRARCYAPIPIVPRPNDRCTSGGGERIAACPLFPFPSREEDGQTDLWVKEERIAEKCDRRERKKGQHETRKREVDGERGEREGGGKKTGGRKRGREAYRAARLAGNYMAFVSDGAFNDLSTSKSL